MKPRLFILLMCIGVAIQDKAYAFDKKVVLPKELKAIAKENDCEEIEDFFDVPGKISPSYVYGYVQGPKEDSAVFWCKKDAGGVRRYFLIVNIKDRFHDLAQCPRKIAWINPAKGLSVFYDGKTTFKGFVYLDDPTRKVVPNEMLKHNAILSEYDGVEEMFYCHEGKWLVRQRD